MSVMKKAAFNLLVTRIAESLESSSEPARLGDVQALVEELQRRAKRDEAEREEPPSGEFLDSLDLFGQTTMDCDFCGRRYVALRDSTDEEIADWERVAKKDKSVVLDYAVEGFEGTVLDDRTFVVGCPCNSAVRYENFIWEHRKLITDYIVLRTAVRLDDAVIDGRLAAALCVAADAPGIAEKVAAELRGECQ